MEPDAVGGYAKPGFEAVRDAFVENFERRNELGAACCVYHRGEKVVDLWGGIRNRATGEPWEEETMALVFSATKGISALAMALAHSRGLFDYDERVSAYWPEFGQQGKERITVRQLLAHQAGLHILDEYPTRDLVADPERLAAVLARQRPAWEPGMYQAYHGITIGFYESELLRRVDPEHRTLGQFFQEELADPLGLEFYIRLPEEIPNARLAPLERPQRMWTMFFSMPLGLMPSGMSPQGCIRRTLEGSELSEADTEHVYARDLEVPAGGGVGTARAMARAYSEFATGGTELGLREEMLRELMAPAIPSAHGFRDRCLKVEIPFSLGFTRPNRRDPFGHRSAFGAEGSGARTASPIPRPGLGMRTSRTRWGPPWWIPASSPCAGRSGARSASRIPTASEAGSSANPAAPVSGEDNPRRTRDLPPRQVAACSREVSHHRRRGSAANPPSLASGGARASRTFLKPRMRVRG